jgi:hypothetical protein
VIGRTTGRLAIGAALVASPACNDDPGPAKHLAEKEIAAEVEHEPLHLYNGFVPDPLVVDGSTAGSFDASSWDESCTGFVDADHPVMVVTDDAFAELKVMAWSSKDVTLVVRDPTGAFRCDDDSDDRHPIVHGAFGQGLHSIWVGSHAAGAEVEYRLGFSELRTVSVASLHH